MLPVPTVTPVTIPDALTVAVPVLLQVPPEVASDKEVVRPRHTVIVPKIAVGNEFTVTIAVVIQPVAVNV